MVVFRSITCVHMPPTVSMPSDSGVTSKSSNPFTEPTNTPPCKAAPRATHSSGLIPLKPSLPVMLFTFSCTAGTLVEPPTSKTLPISPLVICASSIACCTGPAVASTKWAVRALNLARDREISICRGFPLASVRKGRLIEAVSAAERSFFACSAASFNRCITAGWPDKSTLCSLLNSAKSQSTTQASKSSPPRRLFPAVASTSTMPSLMLRTDTSKVPPPKSNTSTFCFSSLSTP